ncbi:MAG: alpha/beta hydrolase [Pseudomonadota bacterium]
MTNTQTPNFPPEFLQGPHGRIAFRRRRGAEPGLVWLGGFRSDMLGTKAECLDAWAIDRGRAFLRFDYSGHGESDGLFEDGAISEWAEDAAHVLNTLTQGRQILIGSSMGAWIAALLAKAHPDRIAGIVFIAPAPDFTEKLMWPAFSDEERRTIMESGKLLQPSEYSPEPEVITRKLIEDGRRQLIMNAPLKFDFPVRILQGMQDDAVPWRHAVEFSDMIECDDLTIQLAKSGDHRLSSPDDLERLKQTLDEIVSA